MRTRKILLSIFSLSATSQLEILTVFVSTNLAFLMPADSHSAMKAAVLGSRFIDSTNMASVILEKANAAKKINQAMTSLLFIAIYWRTKVRVGSYHGYSHTDHKY